MSEADPAGARASLRRRTFLAGATLGGAALTLSAAQHAKASPAGLPPSPRGPALPAAAMEVEPIAPADPADAPATTGVSDYMIDSLRGLGVRHVALVPGATYAALHESLINHGLMTEPRMEAYTVTHEEISVAFAHGYAKVAGEPMACFLHSDVGVQHASMALYNAYCDRAPVIAIAGSLTNPSAREGWVDWMHAASDTPAPVRDFTKFDETPRSAAHYADALGRGYRMAMTPPYGPILLALDLDLQEQALPAKPLPKLVKPKLHAPQGEMSAVEEAAKMLVASENPVIVADRAARTPAGLALIVELAEACNAAVIDVYGRMNFPWRHPLNQTARRAAALRESDLVLGLEVQDFAGVSAAASKARKISINASDYYIRANYQVFQALAQPDLLIAGDSEATLPSLIEAVRREVGRKGASAFAARRARLEDAHKSALIDSRDAAAIGWDVSPITTARLFAELYHQVQHLDWALLAGGHFQSFWPQRLWSADKHHQFIGDSGGYGLAYLPGAAVGAAMAHKAHGRIAIAVGGDGDLMMAPGAIWTAVNQSIPLLYIVHNNGGYHQELMKVQAQCSDRDRGITRAGIGTELPGIDFAKMAQSMGAYGERVTEPNQLQGAIERSLAVVRQGEPAILDVLSQGR